MVGLKDMIDIVRLFIIYKKILFDQNITSGMKPECSDRNLIEISRVDWNFKWDKKTCHFIFLSFFFKCYYTFLSKENKTKLSARVGSHRATCKQNPRAPLAAWVLSFLIFYYRKWCPATAKHRFTEKTTCFKEVKINT